MEKGLITSRNLLGLLACKLQVGTLPVPETLDFRMILRRASLGIAIVFMFLVTELEALPTERRPG